MSAWQLLARSLHAIGGSGRASEFDIVAGCNREAARSGLRRLMLLGLASNNGKRGVDCVWTLTSLGHSWCEGRAEVVEGTRWNKTRVARNWLTSLPTGVRINQMEVA